MSSIACCSGSVDKGTPLGTIETIAGHSVYIGSPVPADRRNLVIIATDVFGYTLPNVRLIADKFASKGYFCVVPDLFKGSEPPADLMDDLEALSAKGSGIRAKMTGVGRLLWHFPGFILRNNDKMGMDIIEAVVADLRATRGVQKIALQGYCWGGNIGIKLAQKDGVLDVASVAHPGGNLAIPQDFDKVVKPIYVALAETDNQINASQCELIKASLEKRSKELGIMQKVEWFLGVEHGFAVRGKESDSHVNSQRERAFADALAFIQKALSL
ncbi:hypothetical protein HDU78_006365 [Chytriomyces hyalinus]|nr:hypothetical protein HDU78_006365 [Chytriomyces hyalinus]KAJ3257304.1 hypothetical protein HDU77_002750 [Chytriomyces hyalinus]